MKLDETIYVSRPDLIELDEEVVNHTDLLEAIHEAASGATEISILGGYYNRQALIDICECVPKAKRSNCVIRIAVGLEATALVPRTWEDMRGVIKALKRLRFRDVTVSIVPRSPVHFHTKLFRILRRTRPVWFVGSANPGSQRHELMVRIYGKHEALSAYIEAVFATALEVTDGTPPIGEIGTLRDFFLSGVLCHKPPQQNLFTFDAFKLNTEDRDRLAAIIAGEAGIEHSRPRTEGFGFSLKSALGLDELLTDSPDNQRVRRIPTRRSCVDTVLGLWMPLAYAAKLQNDWVHEEVARRRKLDELAYSLGDESGQLRVWQAFEAHLSSMERLLAEHNIEAKTEQDCKVAFERFLRSRTATLAHEETRTRLARTMILTDMPDIWEDYRAARAFEMSFFEDVAYRLEMQSGSGGRVIRSLGEALGSEGGETAQELRELLRIRLSESPWRKEDWQST